MNALEVAVDGTVSFMPERLNRDPIVVRGLTSDEVLLAGGGGALFGIPLGIVLWLVSGQIALLPTAILAIGPFLTFFFGSSLLRRLKRGKPQTWVYRLLHWKLLRRFGLSFGERLTTRSGYWTIRRTPLFRLKRRGLQSLREPEFAE